MATNYTEHYQLNQWELEDKVLRADFNADNLKIDGALHALAQGVAGKADSGAVDSLTRTVNAKAEQQDLAAERAERETADTALGGRIDALTPKAGAQMLTTFQLSETCSEFAVPLNDVVWAQWKAVHVLVDIMSTLNTQMQIMIDSNTISYVNGNSQENRDDHANLGHLIFYPMFDGRKNAEFIVLHEGRIGLTARQYRDFNRLYIKSASKDVSILSGTVVTIWGEK